MRRLHSILVTLMNSVFPSDPKRIRQRIRSYEKKLRDELASGWGNDGYGKRYLLGPLYMLFGDVEGALKSYDWFEESYPDDSGEPHQYLTWALALKLGDLEEKAFDKLYQTMLSNLYLVPHLLGENPEPLDIWHGCSRWEIEYAFAIPQELLELWDEDSLRWACEVFEHPGLKQKIDQFIEVKRKSRQSLADRADPDWAMSYSR